MRFETKPAQSGIMISGALLLAVLLMVHGVAAGTRSTELEYFKLVQPPGIVGEQLLFITFDHEVYKYSEPDYSDVRIFNSDGRDIPRVVQRMDGKTGIKPVDFSILDDGIGGVTIIEIRMNREPVTEFWIETGSSKFQRSVGVMISDEDGFVEIARSEIFDRGEDDAHERGLTVSLGEQRSMVYRVEIDNNDQEPLNIQGVTCSGPEYRLVFSGVEGESYQLFWGSSSVGQPRYDVSFLNDRISQGASLRRARVGRGFTNPHHAPGSVPQPDGEEGGAWLLAALAAVILAILALVFLRAGKRSEKI